MNTHESHACNKNNFPFSGRMFAVCDAAVLSYTFAHLAVLLFGFSAKHFQRATHSTEILCNVNSALTVRINPEKPATKMIMTRRKSFTDSLLICSTYLVDIKTNCASIKYCIKLHSSSMNLILLHARTHTKHQTQSMTALDVVISIIIIILVVVNDGTDTFGFWASNNRCQIHKIR